MNIKKYLTKRNIFMIVLALCAIGIAGHIYDGYRHPEFDLYKTTLNYEYGEEIDDLKNNINLSDEEIADISWEIIGDDELEEVGQHVVRYFYRDTVKECTIIVKDTKKPEISSPDEIKTIENEKINYDDYVEIEDLSSCNYTVDESQIDYQLPGTYLATIIAKDKYNNQAKKTISVVIEELHIDLSLKEISLTEGDNQQIEVSSNSTKSITFSSDNSDIVSVSADGKVTAMQAGTTNINVTINGKKVSCPVTVKSKQVSNGRSVTGSGNLSGGNTVSDDYSGYTVYITKTGDCYHRDGCRYLSRSQIAINKSRAVSQGYRACSVCRP